MASRVEPSIEVFYVDTDFLFPETYALVERVSRRYSIQPRALKPRWTPEQQATEFGAVLWERDPDLCCQIRKVEPNGRALEGISRRGFQVCGATSPKAGRRFGWWNGTQSSASSN